MTDYHLYLHTPTPIFKARVNLAGAITYPITALPFDSVTLGAYTDIAPSMTLLLGTTEGADDLGRVRVKYVATSNSIPLPRTARGIEDGTLDVQNNAYITVLDDWRVWAKIPYFDLGDEATPGNDYKDGNIAAGDYNTEIPPVANSGPGFAGYIDPETSLITVQFPKNGVNRSFAMADGATLSTHAWDVMDGTITVGTAASSVITATFPAGFRWVRYEVTDSNGKSHTTRCPVLAIDPADDPTLRNYQMVQRLEEKGQTLDIQLQEPLTRANYPDGTLVMFWWDEAASPGDRDHMKFIGWLDKEDSSIGRKKEGVVHSTTLHCVDVAGRLSFLPGFPQALEREESDSLWSWMPSLDMNKSLHYLLFWHSSALDVADFFLPSDGDDYDAMRLDASGSNLFDQVNSQAMKMVPDHYLVCNSQGQLEVIRDWMLDDVGDRPIEAPILTEALWTDLSFDYSRQPKVHALRSGAILSSTAWVVVEGEDTLPLVFSIAPGDAAAFSQGTIEQQENEGLALSQAALNKCEGHRYALLNSRYGLFNFSDPTVSGFWDYEPALFVRLQMNVSDTYAHFRNLEETQLVGRVKQITVNYRARRQGTSLNVSVTFQKEESGAPALTYNPETGEVTTVPYTPPEVPQADPFNPGLRVGEEKIAGIGQFYLYRTTDFQTPSGSGGPTWTQHDITAALALSEDDAAAHILSWVVDPFSPGYRGLGTEINGWVVTGRYILKLTDIFGTLAVTTVHTFATPIGVGGVTYAGHETRTIQASFGRYQEAEEDNPWLMVVSHYADKTAHVGTWATYSTDGGVTWATEVQISPHYVNNAAAGVWPRRVGVYLSPKTPGLAYAAAYILTAAAASIPSSGFVSTDWGATWTQMRSDPVETGNNYLPYWGVLNEDISEIEVRNGGRFALDLVAHATAGAGDIYQRRYIFFGLHPDTVRIKIEGTWYEGRQESDATSGFTGTISEGITARATKTIDTLNKSSNAPDGGFISSTFVWELTRVGGYNEWTLSRSDLINSPPTSFNPGDYNYIHLTARANAGVAGTATEYLGISWTVTEIELEDSTIYTPDAGVMSINPGNSLAGDIHVPWPNNDDENIIYHGYLDLSGADAVARLKRVTGETIDDISPDDGSAHPFGTTTYGFKVRTYDSDRNYAVFGGRGDVGAANNTGVWVSDDGGDTWTNILTPFATTTAPLEMGVAFSGTDPDVIFAWGGYVDTTHPIYYTDDFGVTLDSRKGNLQTLIDATFGAELFVGICGGPPA